MQDPLEGMIRGTLRRETAAAEPCPDADVLAAFHDGSLPSADRRRIEAHAADCARCAAHLALLARTEPDAAAGSPWRRHWTWAVPLATAATVAAIWVAVPARHDEVPQAADSRGRIESAPLSGDDRRPAIAASEPTVVAPTPAPESSPARATQTAPTTPTVARKTEEARALADAPPPAGSAAAARQPAAPAERDERAPGLAAERIAEDKTAAMTAAPAPPPTAPAPGARDNRAELERTAPQALALQEARASARLRFGSRAVERSLDGGVTWTTEALPTTVPMRVGGCAGGDVCWAAGAAGAIVRREAGGRWLVVTPPAQADIVHLEVHGPDHVTIATADGRRFETRDGGRSWDAH